VPLASLARIGDEVALRARRLGVQTLSVEIAGSRGPVLFTYDQGRVEAVARGWELELSALEHIEEGFEYHDGEKRQLYDASDPKSAAAVLQQQCINWSFGSLTVSGGLDVSVPSVSVKSTLLGVTLASRTLSPSSPGCTIGGSVDGLKAEVTLGFQTSTLALTISGQLCAPFVGCKSFSVTIPFGSVDDA
jgi:hypothetical protein